MLQFYTHRHLAWLQVLKNASSSWSVMLRQLGWEHHDLYRTNLDLAQYTWFGFLRDPNVRHSMGVAQYLWENRLQACLDDPICHPLLASGCLDAHSLPIHAQTPDIIMQRAHWFIMDHEVYDYEVLVRNWLSSQDVTLPEIPRLHQSDASKRQIFQRIQELKQQYPKQHDTLQMVLGADLKLYRSRIQRQHEYLVAGEGFEPPSSGL